MKTIFYLSLITLCISSKAQKYALIDINTKLPIIYTDSVSVHQVKQGYFPVEKNKIDTFLANLNYLSSLIIPAKRSKMESFELHAGATIITVSRVPYAYGDRYKAIAATKSEQVNALSSLTDVKKSEKKMKKEIDGLINYITQNQSLFGNYREIEPKLYNIYVIRE